MNLSLSETNKEIELIDLIHRLRDIGGVVWAQKSLLVRTTVVAGCIGVFMALGSPEEFSASMRVLPYRSGATGGGLSGLAGLAGIRLPTGSADQGITADLYPEVANSLDFRISIAEEPLQFKSIGKQLSTIEYFRDHRPESAIGTLKAYTVGLPDRVLNLVADTDSTSAPLGPSPVSALPTYDRHYLKLVNEIQGRLAIAFDKKTSVITITAKMPDAYASADLVRITSKRLMERIIDLEIRKAGEHFGFISKQHSQAQERYERAQRALAVFADRNRELTGAVSQIDRDRLQREHDLSYEVYQQFSRELEQARIKMNQDTPIFSVLERVTVPSERSSPKRKQMVLLALFFGALGGLVWIGLRQLLTSQRDRQSETLSYTGNR